MVLRCSAASLYGRFLTSLESVAVTSWIAVSGLDVVGIGGTHRFGDGPAEIALLVEDGWQRRGVATALLPHLICDARDPSAPHLWMTALGETLPIIRKLTTGFVGSLQVSLPGGIAEITAELPVPERVWAITPAMGRVIAQTESARAAGRSREPPRA
jgi:hypothetical protein